MKSDVIFMSIIQLGGTRGYNVWDKVIGVFVPESISVKIVPFSKGDSVVWTRDLKSVFFFLLASMN